ncbi:MAG: hypothetical protein MJZ64_01295 [Paludibacteraceae bacterium]|nr:hypothetical protein [Paludibacteraceae bacterium]
MKRILVIVMISALCLTMYARSIVVKDSTMSVTTESWSEDFSEAQGTSYGNLTYTHNDHSWQLVNGIVGSTNNMFGSGNNCAIIRANTGSSTNAASLTSERIPCLSEVQFKVKKDNVKKNDEKVRLYVYVSTNGNKWSMVGDTKTADKYSAGYIDNAGFQNDTWDNIQLYIPTNAAASSTIFSVRLATPTDCYVRWEAVRSGSTNYNVYIDDVTFIHHTWSYSSHEEEKWDMQQTATEGDIGIVCRPKNVPANAYRGVEFYQIAYREGSAMAPTNLVVEQVEDLIAGMPYIYMATGSAMLWDEEGDEALVAGNRNGLYGNLDEITDGKILENTWVIYENALMQVGEGCSMGSNKGYIKMDEVPEQSAGIGVSERKLLSISPRGETTLLPSMWNNSSCTAKQMVKGHILIRRNGHIYSLLGKQL